MNYQLRPNGPGAGGPRGRRRGSAPSDQNALTNEIASFVAGRLLMILFPVRAALQAQGCLDLANAVESRVRDIKLNVGKIVTGYEVRIKD